MTRIAAVRGALPPHRYPQAEITDAFARICLPPGASRRLLDRVHTAAQVRHRHLALPLEEYGKLDGFGAANEKFIEVAVDLGAEAVSSALEAAGLAPADVDMIMFTSVTGIAAPSVDARLAGRLGFRPDVKRVPVFGLGCVAGAAGIARLHDYLRGWPGHVAVLLSVELCSLTLQRGDASPVNLVASGLFGDGAAAVVACGDDRPAAGPEVVGTRAHLYPGSEGVMGWDVSDTGFRVVLDTGVPDVVRAYLPADVDALLAAHGLTARDVAAWVCHPGGPKVLHAVAESLALPEGALELTWRSLADTGNLSSASVLHVLRDTLALRPPPPGTPGVLMAMGPGFCSELVLLRW
ncbi:alpha-pyrone synthesis polyketide synthase-like Pks11 [Sphaerisporangium siamense]|uniref:Alkylresorcinol/alkylpyrone synthase n=1 Tax=Sphaerisporangium siamense TaxID=795645 RepID=A0A7W7DAY2_9ACTN|nr:3-oxoacyl-[acyl-carrier-protein] synthase III C-terminal domain-containing protein [Sphaerisporangium siamense]MBB4703502.1 alkylresorcinol/alkylpyrone synthase [Sphaerisporangium siamense]GII87502.1 alpha-pyrone synthesis polyketide synthase-like Pks11 [Sphaerisporangium siamense]